MTKILLALTALMLVTGVACADVVYPPENVIHVRPSGNDANNGSSWALAKRTVQAGLNAAVSGCEVWVAEATYYERISHKAGVGLYGGFAGTELSRAQRVWQAHPTILDGSRGGSVVGIGDNVTATTVIDGFTIRNGDRFMGGGIMCSGYSCTPVIQNNIITGNYAGTWGGGGIYVEYASPTIRFNTISNNQTYGNFGGGGINVYCGSPTIVNNKIIGNTSTGCGGGVYIVLHWAVVANNIIADNSAAWIGGGVYVNTTGDNTPTIANNTIVGNQVTGTGADKGGGGIGLACYNNGVVVKNNIVSGNSSGIFNRYSGVPDTATNCVYGNTSYNYLGLTPGSDLADDPMLAADYHLQDGSCCIDTGTNSAVGPGWVDIDGGQRTVDTFDYGSFITVDIGADEFGNSMSDTTAPSAPSVNAGATCDLGTSSLTLQADWWAYDPESGIADCQYAVGTSAGGTDVRGWTSTQESSVSIPGLTRTVGATYYVSVRVKNGSNLWSLVATSTPVVVSDVWAIDPLVKVLKTMARPAQAVNSVHIDAVRNEYESGQVIVSAGTTALTSVYASISALTGPSSEVPEVQVRYAGYVPITSGSSVYPWRTNASHLVGVPASSSSPLWVPDPLLESPVGNVPAGENCPVWLTARVPRNAAPGMYTGTISVRTGAVTTNVPLTISVHDAELLDLHPDPSDPNADNRVRLRISEWFFTEKFWRFQKPEQWDWQLLRKYARIMAQHRQNTIWTPCFLHENSLVKAIEDSQGNFTFDFTWFDEWVRVFKEEGVLGVPGSPDGPITGLIEGLQLGYQVRDSSGNFLRIAPYGPYIYPAGGGNPTLYYKPEVNVNGSAPEDVRYRRLLGQYLVALQSHLTARGWQNNFVQHVMDEPNTSTESAYRQYAEFMKSYVPQLKIIEATGSMNLVGCIDTWVPLTGRSAHTWEYVADFDRYKESFYWPRQTAGDDVWFYVCCWPTITTVPYLKTYMNRFIDYPLIDTRLLHWANFRFHTPGFLHWALNAWSSGNSPYVHTEIDGLPPGDAFMVYPKVFGTDNTPISSIRYEAMRDGIEDYELLKTLEALDSASAESICGYVVPSLSNSYVTDPVVFQGKRLELINVLVSHGQ